MTKLINKFVIKKKTPLVLRGVAVVVTSIAVVWCLAVVVTSDCSWCCCGSGSRSRSRRVETLFINNYQYSKEEK